MIEILCYVTQKNIRFVKKNVFSEGNLFDLFGINIKKKMLMRMTPALTTNIFELDATTLLRSTVEIFSFCKKGL
jgi:hypothetical protein